MRAVLGATPARLLGAVALLLAAVSLAASWSPARRAARADPVTALQAEWARAVRVRRGSSPFLKRLRPLPCAELEGPALAGFAAFAIDARHGFIPFRPMVMSVRTELRLGLVFDSRSDLLVVPCTRRGTFAPAIDSALSEHALPRPGHRFKAGEIDFEKIGHRYFPYIAFVAAGSGKTSSLAVIESIGARLGEYTRQYSAIRSVSAPLFDGRGISTQASANALRRGFLGTAAAESILAIHTPHADEFSLLQRTMSVWGDPVDDPAGADERAVGERGRGSSPGPPLIFISYSHEDSRWLKQLRRHLVGLEEYGLAVWDDTRIKPGSNWPEEIRKALLAARVAVLLVTQDFMASEFIRAREVPPLLSAAKERGVLILPVIVGHSRYGRDERFKSIQAFNDLERPLKRLDSDKRDEILDNLTRMIEDHLKVGT